MIWKVRVRRAGTRESGTGREGPDGAREVLYCGVWLRTVWTQGVYAGGPGGQGAGREGEGGRRAWGIVAEGEAAVQFWAYALGGWAWGER